VSDADSDLDGTADCNDGCPLDANKLLPASAVAVFRRGQ